MQIPPSFNNMSESSDSNLWYLTSAQIDNCADGFKTLLGTGGFSKVYRGQLYGTDVAIKQLNNMVAKDESQDGFWKEVSTLAKLSHPHILLLIGFSAERRALVTELMEGGSLQEILDGNPKMPSLHLSWFDRFRISLEISSGLLHMHLRGILHRDLKPGNVLLDNHGVSKLADVGLAKLTSGQHQTMFSEIRGTNGYVDPHQQLTGELCRESDVYGLALIILQLFTGTSRINEMHQILEKAQGNRRSGKESRDLKSILESLNSESDLGSKFVVEDIGSLLTGRWLNGIDKAVADVFESLDPSAGQWPEKETKTILRLLLRCVEKRKDDRPSLETEIVPKLYEIVKKGNSTEMKNRGSQGSVQSAVVDQSRSATSSEKAGGVSQKKVETPNSWLADEDVGGADAVLGLNTSSDGSSGLEMPFRFSGLLKYRPPDGLGLEPREDSNMDINVVSKVERGISPSVLIESPNGKERWSSHSTPKGTSSGRTTISASRSTGGLHHWTTKRGWLYRLNGTQWGSIQWEPRFFILHSNPPLLSCYRSEATNLSEVPEKTYPLGSSSEVVDRGSLHVSGKVLHSFSVSGRFKLLNLAVEGKSQLDHWIYELKNALNEASTPDFI